MKFLIGVVIAVSFSTLCNASIAGDWAGVLNFPPGPLRIVLHVIGADSNLKATHDSPDQRTYGGAVSSITLTGSTLKFSIPSVDVTFSGDVLSENKIVGTFYQRGQGYPLVLERSATALPTSGSPRPLTEPPGILQGRHYHHNLTGVEFDLPPGWSIGIPRPSQGDPVEMTVLLDPKGRALFASADMTPANLSPAAIPRALSNVIPQLIARRAGLTSAGPPHTIANYKIRDGSVEQTVIGGRQAVRAIGDYELGGRKTSELLTWIFTERTRTFFFAQMATEDLPAFQVPFEQIIQSAGIP